MVVATFCSKEEQPEGGVVYLLFIVQSVSQNLIEIQYLNVLDLGKVLWNECYTKDNYICGGTCFM